MRAREREEARLKPPPEVKEKVESESGWESVSGITESTGHRVSPPSDVLEPSSPADVRDVMTSEVQGGHDHQVHSLQAHYRSLLRLLMDSTSLHFPVPV